MLAFNHNGLDERNISSKGSYEPSKDTQVIRVWGAAAPQVFELLVYANNVFFII